MSDPVVIVGMSRTPMGGMQGSLSAMRALELGVKVIAGALAEVKVDAADVNEVLMGCVLPASLVYPSSIIIVWRCICANRTMTVSVLITGGLASRMCLLQMTHPLSIWGSGISKR